MYDTYTQQIYKYLTDGDLIDKIGTLIDHAETIIDRLVGIMGTLGDIAFIAVFGIALYFALKMISKGWFRL